MVLLAGCGGKDHVKATKHGTHGEGDVAAGNAVDREPKIPVGSGHLAAMAGKKGLTLRDKPNGSVIAHLEPTTAYGSPTVVWAAGRRGHWLGVVTPALPNNRLGWMDVNHDRPRMWRTRLELVADLSDRTLELLRYGHVYRRIPVTIGHPDTPTPLGRFAVTDKLRPDQGGDYGCCILALSGHQPNLRPGWAGGDRIAIHGSPSDAAGGAASAGCLRAHDRDLRFLLKRIVLGTPVVIKA